MTDEKETKHAFARSSSNAGLCVPHVSWDEDRNLMMEWWSGDRKITMYPQDGLLLKVWGPNIDTEMEEIALQDVEAVRASFDWLTHNVELRGSAL